MKTEEPLNRLRMYMDNASYDMTISQVTEVIDLIVSQESEIKHLKRRVELLLMVQDSDADLISTYRNTIIKPF